MNERQAGRVDWRPMHALLLIGLIAVASLLPAFRVWPWFWLVPLVVYGALVAVVPPLRVTFRPWRFGRVSTPVAVATVIVAMVSCAVLVAFDALVHPDVSGFGRVLPVSALGGVLVAGVVFSVGNALGEEIIFRGVLFDAFEAQWGEWVAVVGTAVLFGYGHREGYPPGALGAVLAGLYGLALGWLRKFSGGLGWPVLAHIAADATIFTLVARAGVW